MWSLDVQFDQTRGGKALKLLNVIDEFTRECLAIEVERSITVEDVASLLDCLGGQRGVPCFRRCETGPDFAPYAIADWCRFNASEST